MDRIITQFLELTHNTDLTVKYSQYQRIDSFLVKAAPQGNVTITLNNTSPEDYEDTGISVAHVFPATAFIVGNIYHFNLLKIEYANEADQTTPPFIGLV